MTNRGLFFAGVGALSALVLSGCASVTEEDDAPAQDSSAGSDQAEAESSPEAEREGGVTLEVSADVEGATIEGEEIVYTFEMEVTNHDDADKVISHSLPAGFESSSSEPEAEVIASEALWGLPAEESLTIRHEATAGSAEEIEEGQLIEVEPDDDVPEDSEFTSTVCVHLEGSDEGALTCTSVHF